MRLAPVLGLLLSLAACGGGESQGGDVRAPDGVDAVPAEALFGDWGPDADGSRPQADGVTPDVSADTATDAATDPSTPDTPGDGSPEMVVPVTWDVLVLTAANGHLFRNGAFLTIVQRTSDAPFVALDGLMTRYYTLTQDGQGRTDGSPSFEADGVPNGVTFLDAAVSATPQGAYFFTLQSNGQVRNNGGHMLTVAPPAGQAWAAIAADGADFYLATTSGTLFLKGQIYGQMAIPVPAGDTLVSLRVVSGQFYALTRFGRVYKNTVLLHELSSTLPFVGFDTNGEHVWAVDRGCSIFQDGAGAGTLSTFSGDYCAALALVHSLD